MTALDVLPWAALMLALIPLVLVVWNLALVRRLPATTSDCLVSVLIPARNEAANIGFAIESVLANVDCPFELLVLDDDSDDTTAAIVAEKSRRDSRVRLLQPDSFDPALWGKPQACAALGAAARGEHLVFMDADVRLEPDALSRISGALGRSGAAMLSGIPRQVTPGLIEQLIVPLIQFVLLGFLPFTGMRSSRRPGYGVACGQLLAVERDAYVASGGHRRIADRIHDGMALARQFRHAGFMTDVADFSDIASCRMYSSTRELVAGFAKNAHEGLGSPLGIVPWTVLLIGGQCAWIAMLPLAMNHPPTGVAVALNGIAAFAARGLIDLRFAQLKAGSLLHPLGIALLVAIQWYALVRRLAGRPVAWKARVPVGADGAIDSAGRAPSP